jgi:DnaJ family protein A protein 5
MVHDSKPRCHYEVLGVEQSSDEATIKKAHRKNALIWHPDKNGSRVQEATHEFRLVQEAYECLSDKVERKWYDEHREAILRGHTVGSAGGMDAGDMSFVFDIIPFMHGGCYDGYEDNDDNDGFFQVYSQVFQDILQGEIEGYKSEGNIELTDILHLLQDASFGSAESDWSGTVSPFYKAWESFSSSLSFAWVDEYDTRDAPSRRARRAMEDANKKVRRSNKKERNDDILALLKFVKKRDPRVGVHNLQVEQERAEREERQAEEAARKKLENQLAREAWRADQQALMEEADADALDAGRIRLADLDDDDYFYADKHKKGKKGNKSKKNRGQKQSTPDPQLEQEEATEGDLEEDLDAGSSAQETPEVSKSGEENGDEATNVSESSIEGKNAGQIAEQPTRSQASDGNTFVEEPKQQQGCQVSDDDNSIVTSSSDEESTESSEPDFWQCECCRKEFKSEGQMNNHLKSKKHKETYKKYNAKLAKEAKLMDEFLDETQA